MLEEALKRISQKKTGDLDIDFLKLNLSGLNLTKIPEELFDLEKLIHLDLRNNQIEDISSLSKLKKLTHLYLDNNKITNIKPLSRIKELNCLLISNNRFKDIKGFVKLEKLTVLELCQSQVKDIAPLAKLKNLTHISLYHNRFASIKPIASLKELVFLDLRQNHLTDIDIKNIAHLNKLEIVYLKNNEITNLFHLIPLIKRGVPIRDSLAYSPEKGIIIEHNPIQTPPISIIEKGNEAILTYFNDLEIQGSGKFYEAKIIIVGEPDAGKTTLMKKIINPNYKVPQKEDTTIGIQVKEGWKFNHPDNESLLFSANIWDFGGQQIQYMTHQFFLTPGALYILVASNDRKESTRNFPYWFRIIHLLGEEKRQYSPVLVVLNAKEDIYINKFQFDRIETENIYPNLEIEEQKIDFRDDIEFSTLRHMIQKMLTRLPHVTVERPAKWFEIRQNLQKEAQTKNHITFEEYASICTQNGVLEEKSQLLLSHYLHRLGSLLHFQDSGLVDFIILQPQWAVDAVYSVLKNTAIADADGIFTKKEFDSILADYSTVEREKILSLMKQENFEICYELVKGKRYLTPQLVSSVKPLYEWGKGDLLKYRFQYRFMPEGVIPRLIVRLNRLIAKDRQGKEILWRKGVLLLRGQCQAEVVEKVNNKGLKVIDIDVRNGRVDERRTLLHIIVDEINDLHQKWFSNISIEQMIPCNCLYCGNPINKDTQYFAYSLLRRYQEKSRETIVCEKSLNNIQIEPILDGVFHGRKLENNNFHPVVKQIIKTKNKQTNQEKKKVKLSSWWTISVIISLILGSLGGYYSGNLLSGILISLVSFITIFFFNPKRRFFRTALLILGVVGLKATPFLKGEIKFGKMTLSFGETMNPWVSAILISSAIFLFWLDDKQK